MSQQIGCQKLERDRNFLTGTLNIDKGLDNTVIFLTEPAKKDVIEALKMLEAIKRKLLILVK